MPRLARVVGIGLPHHITQRGNYRQSVFNSDDDRSRYLRWVAEYSGKHDLNTVSGIPRAQAWPTPAKSAFIKNLK